MDLQTAVCPRVEQVQGILLPDSSPKNMIAPSIHQRYNWPSEWDGCRGVVSTKCGR